MILSNRHQLQMYLFWGVILGLIALASFLVLPFAIAVISAYLLAYVVRPLFLKLVPRFKTSLAAIICVLVVIILIVVPVSLVTLGMINQVGDSVSKSSIHKYIILVATHPLLRGFNLNSNTMQTQLNTFISDVVGSVLASIPNMAVGLIITIIGIYYMLCCWDALSEHLKKYIPSQNKERIIRNLNKTTQAILYGTVVMAILEFFIAYIGFTLSGVEASLILAAIVFVLAFVPSIGPIMVWAPMALYYLSNQQYDIAIGVTIVGLILTVGVETILYAKWIGDKTRIHPFVMLLGVIGGINLFGIFGFIIGPLVLASALDVLSSAMEKDSSDA